MKKLMTIAIPALTVALCTTGCKSVSVSTPDWNAHYISFGQENDLQGLKVKAGENVALELEAVRSGIDPAVKEAMKTAAAALAAASRACAACATGGASEAVAAVAAATSDCTTGACKPQ